MYFPSTAIRLSDAALFPRLLRIFNAVALLLTLVVNYLANALPLGGKTTGQLSDQYPNLFTPAGLTFSIWIVIYIAAILFVIWQAVPMRNELRKQRRDEAVLALGWNFVGLCALNIGWLFCWHYEWLLTSVLIMFVTLFLLIWINRLVFIHLAHAPDYRNYLQIPFGLYLGWISVATVANVTACLVALRWNGWGISDRSWTLILMLIATVLAVIAVQKWKNIPYALAVAWALLGISIKQRQLFDVPFTLVTSGAYLGMLALLIVMARRVASWWNSARDTRRPVTIHP